MTTDSTDIRVNLRFLAKMREAHIEEGFVLDQMIAATVGDARAAGVSMREAADLLGLAGRTQLYTLIERAKELSGAAAD